MSNCLDCGLSVYPFEGYTACPACGSSRIPMEHKQDVYVHATWPELKLLCCWAEQHGMQLGAVSSVRRIAHQFEQQYPHFGPLTDAA